MREKHWSGPSYSVGQSATLTSLRLTASKEKSAEHGILYSMQIENKKEIAFYSYLF